MSDSLWNLIRNLLLLIMFVAGVALVIIGQKHIGPTGLVTMLIGMAMLIGLLWVYNRKYK